MKIAIIDQVTGLSKNSQITCGDCILFTFIYSTQKNSKGAISSPKMSKVAYIMCLKNKHIANEEGGSKNEMFFEKLNVFNLRRVTSQGFKIS